MYAVMTVYIASYNLLLHCYQMHFVKITTREIRRQPCSATMGQETLKVPGAKKKIKDHCPHPKTL